MSPFANSMSFTVNLVHYEEDTIVSPPQSLSFILEGKSPDSEVPQDDVSESQFNIPYMSFSLSDSL